MTLATSPCSWNTCVDVHQQCEPSKRRDIAVSFPWLAMVQLAAVFIILPPLPVCIVHQRMCNTELNKKILLASETVIQDFMSQPWNAVLNCASWGKRAKKGTISKSRINWLQAITIQSACFPGSLYIQLAATVQGAKSYLSINHKLIYQRTM